MLSFQLKFLKNSFTKVALKVICQQISFLLLVGRSQGHVLGHRATPGTPFLVTFPTERARQRVKEWRDDIFMKEWMKALEKTILAPADIQYIFSFEIPVRANFIIIITAPVQSRYTIYMEPNSNAPGPPICVKIDWAIYVLEGSFYFELLPTECWDGDRNNPNEKSFFCNLYSFWKLISLSLSFS